MSKETSADKPTRDELEATIEQTREQLGETVEALTAKMDVTGRTKAKVAETVTETKDKAAAGLATAQHKAVDLTKHAQSAATTDDGKPTPIALAAVAGVVVGTIALVVLSWRARSR